MSDASPESFVFAITDDIPKFDIRPEISKQTRNDVQALLVSYRPNKMKTTDIELSITVTDDKPIYHSPRRLPFTERDIVDKQIDEWTQNGHIIENNKLFPSPSKTKSVVHYPEPKTTKEVQRFLGLTGYFRKFIPAYSVIAKPLSDLLRKDTPFNFEMSEDDPRKWFKHVPSLQEVLNSTFQRSINITPFELLFGTQINNKTDLHIQQLIDEQL
ncbi:transposon Ty3-I Gag-Pol polyprotein [Trichonephila inaurata madagascariensis]|uniref:RNA-directed DNA polymerase n=1 Tax=Trichonephila inaurata madagascariensis TaxID=2747483 RepID=A0A8X6YNW2_9ARAC|nr:transposon Ty3-I Gag-Pol polyprotein [Trichonephila inaurata madagascariensis]